MLGNIKFKAIEDLKMLRADNINEPEKDPPGNDGQYDYDFLGYVKDQMHIKQIDDDMNYQDSFNVSKMRTDEKQELITCLNNVLSLAEQKLNEYKAQASNSSSIDLKTKIDIDEVSIRAVKIFFRNCQRTKDV